MSGRRALLRLGALAILALAIGGPTPGYVGNCDASSNGGPAVTPREFCTHRTHNTCARDNALGRFTVSQYNDCQADAHINAVCNGFNFPNGCMPPTSAANACYDALLDGSRLGTSCSFTPTVNCGLSECQFTSICGASPLEGI